MRRFRGPVLAFCAVTAGVALALQRHFGFDEFYRRLSDKGFIIYPGRISRANTFRIGSIGRIFPGDMEALLGAIQGVLHEMGVDFTLR